MGAARALLGWKSGNIFTYHFHQMDTILNYTLKSIMSPNYFRDAGAGSEESNFGIRRPVRAKGSSSSGSSTSSEESEDGSSEEDTLTQESPLDMPAKGPGPTTRAGGIKSPKPKRAKRLPAKLLS